MLDPTTLFPKALYLPPVVAQSIILQIFVPTSVPTAFHLTTLDLTTTFLAVFDVRGKTNAVETNVLRTAVT
jgi:hypothetical protein